MLRFRYCLVLLALPLLAQRSIPIENEFVRVLSVVDQHAPKPGTVHEHKENRVMIYLDAGDINIRYAEPKGEHKDEDQHWKSGDVAWSPAGGLHTSQHVSAAPTRIIEIELRKPPAAELLATGPTNLLLKKPQVLVYKSATAPPAQWNYVAVDPKTAETVWNRLPAGPGPFIISLLN